MRCDFSLACFLVSSLVISDKDNFPKGVLKTKQAHECRKLSHSLDLSQQIQSTNLQ